MPSDRRSAKERYELTLPFDDSIELVTDILLYRPAMKVVGPVSLRRAVEKKLSEALAVYQ